MSRRMGAEEYEEQDGWIARLRDRWFGEGEEEDDEEAPRAHGTSAGQPRNGTRKPAPNGTLLQIHAHRGSQITKRVPRSLADAQRAAEDLKERRPVIVNLER